MESLKTLFFGALPPKEEIWVYNLILGDRGIPALPC